MFALLWLVIVLPWSVDGYSTFQARIPNGDNVRDPCDDVTIWPGVGHEAIGGTGPRNPFGLSFYANNMVWNKTICEMDSDGDGMSNGEELGDPDCVWTPGDELATTPTGHPGICEPWSDPVCLQRNTWYSCQTKEIECDAINSPDVKNLTIVFPETDVPAQETTYMCMNFEFPFDTDYHVIADVGKIDNQHVMHHILIYACPIDRKLETLKNPLNTPYVCGMIGESGCLDIIAMWSVGAPGVCHNERAGFRIGRTGYKYASMQLHWNNPRRVANYTDSSGMVLYYTPVLRDYNLGNLMLGENRFAIPPGESSYTIDSECSSVCSERYMNDSIHITSGTNHMHYMGKAMTTSLVPQGGTEQVIMADPHFSYDNPVLHTFDNPILVHPGDVLRTSCTYTSKTKARTTYQGDATSDEMCYAFLIYYPNEALASSQCSTVNGIPICSLRSSTDIVDGCQIQSFLGNTSMLTALLTKINELCSQFTCQKECKEYITEMRKNPCLQGKVGDFITNQLMASLTAEHLVRYYSCDVEITLEAQTCECTTPKPLTCDPSPAKRRRTWF